MTADDPKLFFQMMNIYSGNTIWGYRTPPSGYMQHTIQIVSTSKGFERTILVFEIQLHENCEIDFQKFWLDFRNFREAGSQRLGEFFRDPWKYILSGSCAACSHKKECDIPIYMSYMNH